MYAGFVTEYLDAEGRRINGEETVAGGCINDARRLHLDDGSSVFLKTNPDLPADAFAAEAAGLAAIAAVADAPRVPRVLAVAADGILLEDLPPGPKTRDHHSTFGRRLATLHAAPAPHFGFACDTFCGATRQPNPPTSDGYRFYAEQRFGYQIRLARDHGRVDRSAVTQVERLGARLGELVPDQGPALLHGDLWAGNAHVDPAGEPALIDPACYFGWPEAELAMTRLFGGFPEAFYAAYEAASPTLARDWRERVDLHNVYHLLNHGNLFGGGYFDQALRIVADYV